MKYYDYDYSLNSYLRYWNFFNTAYFFGIKMNISCNIGSRKPPIIFLTYRHLSYKYDYYMLYIKLDVYAQHTLHDMISTDATYVHLIIRNLRTLCCINMFSSSFNHELLMFVFWDVCVNFNSLQRL